MFQFSFDGDSNHLEMLTKTGDSLVRLNQVIDWEIFRTTLTEAVESVTKRKVKDNRGRPSFDVVTMFKILVLQRLYNLSDDGMEHALYDRVSFMRFTGFSYGEHMPDAKTIWLYREHLTQAGAIDSLFALYEKQLEEANLISHEGSIVDATFVEAPRQRNTREENKMIKEGKIPEEWKSEKNTNKLRQKDTDARWAVKNGENHFGFKNHAKVDANSKLIVKYKVTSANVHDSQTLKDLVDQKDKVLYADSAYSGKDLLASLPESLEIQVNEKGTRDHPLTEEQKENNRRKSKVRCKVEHVFAQIEGSMHGITVRSIGMERANFNVGMMNLVYNFKRYEMLLRQQEIKG